MRRVIIDDYELEISSDEAKNCIEAMIKAEKIMESTTLEHWAAIRITEIEHENE